MMTTGTFVAVDAVSGRIDRLAGHVASAAVSLATEMSDAIVSDALRQVCELLNAEGATLEGLSEETPNAAPHRTWIRHGKPVTSEAAFTVSVTVSEASPFSL